MSVGSDPLLTDPEVGLNNLSQVNALKSIVGLGGGALALGAGARGLSGLGNFFGRNLGGPHAHSDAAVVRPDPGAGQGTDSRGARCHPRGDRTRPGAR